MGASEALRGHSDVILGSLWVTWRSFGHYFGSMTVALGDFLLIFDVENEFDVQNWWLVGVGNRKC